MPSTVTLLYPAVEFDLKYYLENHMAMVQETWGSKGLTRWQVTQLDPESGYCTQCVLEWESEEAFGKAAKEDNTKIMGDIHNYTKGKPLVLVGHVVGSA